MSHHRVKELECHLEEETTAHREVKRSVERLKETVSGLKSSLKKEERKSETVNEQLQRWVDVGSSVHEHVYQRSN